MIGPSALAIIPLIICGGEKRSTFAPGTPTMIESGLPGFIVRSPFGFVGPAGIPRPIVERLNGALVTALREPEIRKAIVTAGAEPIGSSPDEHAASIRSEIEKWKKVGRDANIEPQ